MAFLYFNKDFVSAIINGEKTQTVRSKIQKDYLGNGKIVHLYENMENEEFKKIIDVQITTINRIKIFIDYCSDNTLKIKKILIDIIFENYLITEHDKIEEFAVQDGFKADKNKSAASKMAEFLLPKCYNYMEEINFIFDGYLIKWEKITN